MKYKKQYKYNFKQSAKSKQLKEHLLKSPKCQAEFDIWYEKLIKDAEKKFK